jgi:hypothetical protein
MFPRGRPSLAPALLLLAGVSLATLVGSLLSRNPAAPDMHGWGMPDLLHHLETRGLHYHAIPTLENAPILWSAYLTRQERPWEDYGRHCMDPGRIDRWSGVVYCQREVREEAREFEVLLWGECGLRAGPFVFFGDPAMLAEIRAALGIPD